MADDKLNVAIIGAGVSGITLAIRLKRAGFNDFTIYERDSGVAGTWLTNTYPGCRCDVAAHWYSLSTHLNPTWSESHPPQTEILEYWQRIAVEEGVMEHTRFGVNFKSAKWNAETSRWELELDEGVWLSSESANAHTSNGKSLKLEARVLVSGIGGFSKPIVPDIKGLPSGTGLRSTPAKGEVDGNFAGIVVHSARYPRQGLDLSGKSVLVIGNGCSGSQIVPEISKDPSTKVFAAARSAQWFMPHKLGKYSQIRLALYRMLPFLARVHRFFLWIMVDWLWWALRLEKGKWLRDPIENQMRKYMQKTAPPETIDTLLPTFPWGSKRFIRDTGYLRSLHQDNVTPIITGIRELKQNSFVTNDGQEHPIDVVILATGFNLMAAQLELTGRDGIRIKDVLVKKQAAEIYLGMNLPGFPNYTFMLGPNTAPSHASVIYQIEVQADYITQHVLAMKEHDIKALEVKQIASKTYDDWLEPRLQSTVWTQASGFYHAGNNKNARITTNWPGPVALYWLQNAVVRWEDFVGAEKLARGQTEVGRWLGTAWKVAKFLVWPS